MHAASLPRFRRDHRRWLLIAAVGATIVALSALLAAAGIIAAEIGPSQPAEIELLGPFRWRPGQSVA